MIYLDASALVKLVIEEPETSQLRTAVSGRADIVSSLISRVELARALQRVTAAGRVSSRQLQVLRERAEQAFARLGLLPIDDQVVRLAQSVEPTSLRSLDAIHLATALSIGTVEAVITYDNRLAKASVRNGLSVLSPGQA